MLQEKSYKFLLAIKKFKPETKFIISVDYNQLEPVADRISPEYNYARNPAIFELCNFNKVQLTKCRRADDKLFYLIREPYLIHQWQRYTNKMRYIVLSKSTTYEHINIY